MSFKKLLAALLVLTTLTVTACSDDPASGIDEEPGKNAPEIPEVTAFEQIDLSFFDIDEGASPDLDPENPTAFQQAQIFSSFANTQAIYSSFFMVVFSGSYGVDPEFQNGKWIWTYSWEVEDIEDDMFQREETPLTQHLGFLAKSESNMMTINVVAEPVSDGTKWELYISGNVDGEDVTDFLMLEGTISDDERVGEWKFYETVSSEPSIHVTWNIEDDNKHFNLTLQGDEGDEPIVITLRQEQNDNWVEFKEGKTIVVYWNVETGLGYFEDDGVRTCFSREENYQDVECAA